MTVTPGTLRPYHVGMSQPARFAFRFADSYRRPARLFGITPETAWVEVGD